jgi:hypothetical protein
MGKKTPLRYYINLFITERSLLFVNDSWVGRISNAYTWFSYIETYMIGNATYPQAVQDLIVELNDALAEVFGLNPDDASAYIINYFVNNDYNKYLDLVTYRDVNLSNKN